MTDRDLLLKIQEVIVTTVDDVEELPLTILELIAAHLHGEEDHDA